ncbi:hypothetical protein DAPPUDRAFT_115583 [Daphnia pulex]|uniref:Uncharacterized protein n=1 Tax=Daphnia pulex TaxID=6669 RepID=E9HLV7_DAPPU|nr:hypothetical protein DAPPUDRAFT_115583 [Daphnia pulex]|eukprot:EFX67248.1 hypothetical protein DAPPUDRAFT_115583 [Daphnia pulex]
MSSAVISEPVITIFQLSDYAKGLVAEWFVNTDYVPPVINTVKELDDDCVDVVEEHQVEILSHCNSAPSTDSNSQPSTSNNSSLYTCCTEVHENGAVVTCSNVDCLVGTYHKLCVKSPRKRFGPTWKKCKYYPNGLG